MSYDLDDLEKDIIELANDVSGGKHAKKFLRKQGAKLNKANKSRAKSVNIGKKTGNFMKGFKKGKPYKFKSNQWSIRAYNSSSHAHLLEDGHIQYSHGEEVGFTEGKHFMEKAREDIKDGYYDDVQEFIDDLIDSHGF